LQRQKNNNDTNLDKATRIQQREEKKAAEKQVKSLKNKINKIEKNIETLEKEIKALEIQLADPVFYHDKEKSAEAIATYESKKATLDKDMESWEQLQATLDDIT